MIIIAGKSHQELAKTIATKLSAPLIIANTKKFEDQELRIQVDGNLYEQDVVIVQSTSKPANDHLMELLLLADTAKRAGARQITALIPYFGYSRQDRPSYSNGPISASMVANLLEAAGINRVITLDLHSKQIEGFFRIGVLHFDALALFAKQFKNSNKDYIIVSPDVGGVTRAQKLADILELDIAIINKSRESNGDCVMNSVIGDVSKKNCILIDDIVDTSTTLIKACELLLQKNALSVCACVTHAVLSGNSIKNIENSPLTNLYVTDSIHNEKLPDKVKVITVSDIFIDALKVIK
jgi:ribose-phosphate pyrophosphokinase